MSKNLPEVDLIGVPCDLGANIRGAKMGPAAIRIAEIHDKLKTLGVTSTDLGDVVVPVRETIGSSGLKDKFLKPIQQICQELFDRVCHSHHQGHIPLTIGGDHCVAIGSISAVSHCLGLEKKKLGLLWFDAHADVNTPETSPTGNIHGMPLSCLIGHGHRELIDIGGQGPKVKPTNTVLVGVRSIDAGEKNYLKQQGIRCFSMREIDERGMQSVMEEAIARVSEGTDGIHVSFDLDAVDPIYAPGVSTPVSGGMSDRESHLALEMIADSGRLTSMDFVELNPMTDINHQSALLIVELIQSLLGKSIL